MAVIDSFTTVIDNSSQIIWLNWLVHKAACVW